MIIVKIPELLEQHSMNASDLMRKGNLAYATALRLAKGGGTGMSFDVLESMCVLFDVGVSDILEYVPEEEPEAET